MCLFFGLTQFDSARSLLSSPEWQGLTFLWQPGYLLEGVSLTDEIRKYSVFISGNLNCWTWWHSKLQQISESTNTGEKVNFTPQRFSENYLALNTQTLLFTENIFGLLHRHESSLATQACLRGRKGWPRSRGVTGARLDCLKLLNMGKQMSGVWFESAARGKAPNVNCLCVRQCWKYQRHKLLFRWK